jgi:hypothetical protein
MGKGDYICPPDAGPAWRKAFELGYDMEELETNIKLTPEERLDRHERKMKEWMGFEIFMELMYRGESFIRRQHGYPS